MRIVTKIENTSPGDILNLRYWIGTQDDWVGVSDSPTETKGTLSGATFTNIATTSDPSNILKIESAGTAVLFYSTYDASRVNMITNSYGAFASNVVPTDPTSSSIITTGDSSYGMYVRLNDLLAGQTDQFTWYYAAGPS